MVETASVDDDGSSSSLVWSSSWSLICCLSISSMLFRMSIDLIQTASLKTTKDYTEDHHNTTKSKDTKKQSKEGEGYGSITSTTNKDDNGDTENPTTEQESLIQQTPSTSTVSSFHRRFFLDSNQPGTWSFRFQLVILLILLVAGLIHPTSVLPEGLIWSCFVVVLFGTTLTYRDVYRTRFGIISRLFYLLSTLTLVVPLTICYYRYRNETDSGDELIVNIMGLYLLLSVGECFFVSLPTKITTTSDTQRPPKKQRLSRSAILTLLKPYFWPDHTAESAATNRIRAIMTWVCVILSKVCNLTSPILVSIFRSHGGVSVWTTMVIWFLTALIT